MSVLTHIKPNNLNAVIKDEQYPVDTRTGIRNTNVYPKTTTTVFTAFPTDMEIEPEYSSVALSPMSARSTGTKTSFSTTDTTIDLQQRYRANMATFFATTSNYERLARIVYNRDDRIFSILLFFVIRYKTENIYPCQRTYDTGPEVNKEGKPVFFFYRPKEEYGRALKKYKKKFYNFEDKVGSGPLVWKGITNPKFHVSPDNGPISLPLAKLISVYWVIQYGFDVVFWDNYDNILSNYETFTYKTKRRYTEAHKKKKQQIRAEIEEQVIAERDRKIKEEAERNGRAKKKRRRKAFDNKNRRKTRLCRELRKQVTEMIQDRKRKIKEQNADDKKGKKRKRPPQKQTKVATTIMFNPPSIVF